LVIVTLVWVAVLAAGVAYAARFAAPTSRDQTTVEQARPTVDEAVARVATAAASGGGAVVAISPFEHVEVCDVTVFRGGERYRRGVTVVVPPGTEADLLTRVAEQLPESYGTVVRAGEAPRMTADAGFWVLVTAAKTAPGEVRFYADTGDCREAGRVDTSDPAVAVDETSLRGVLERLNLDGTERRTSAVLCPGGGSIGTVEVRTGPFPDALDVALEDVAGPDPVVSSARLLAFHSGSTQVAVRANQDSVIVTATRSC
jgi:hypothetical protein